MPLKSRDMPMTKLLLNELDTHHWIQIYGMNNMQKYVAETLQKHDVTTQWLEAHDHAMDEKFAEYVTKWVHLDDIEIDDNFEIQTLLHANSEVSKYIFYAPDGKPKAERQQILREVEHDMQLIKDHVYLTNEEQSNQFSQYQRWEIKSYAIGVRNMESKISTLFRDKLQYQELNRN